MSQGGTMTIIISLIIGFAVGCLVNYAITFRTGQARNIGVCVGGALIGGALIPWALQVPNAWTAILGSLIGVAVVLWISLKMMKKA
jgi:uncharacterized membrane protein YeaQ/YmgE (transglycosylase-associated protein family)